MPYDQGVAEAKLAALALLGEETPSYVAVPAETVTHGKWFYYHCSSCT